MKIGIFEPPRGLWRESFSQRTARKLERAADSASRRWDVLMLAPGCLPKRAAADILIVSGTDDARSLGVSQRVRYGLSDRDSVSVSSLLDCDMMLILRNGLLSAAGLEIEPREWRVTKHPNWSIDQTLAFEALSLLLGEFPGISAP